MMEEGILETSDKGFNYELATVVILVMMEEGILGAKETVYTGRSVVILVMMEEGILVNPIINDASKQEAS